MDRSWCSLSSTLYSLVVPNKKNKRWGHLFWVLRRSINLTLLFQFVCRRLDKRRQRLSEITSILSHEKQKMINWKLPFGYQHFDENDINCIFNERNLPCSHLIMRHGSFGLELSIHLESDFKSNIRKSFRNCLEADWYRVYMWGARLRAHPYESVALRALQSRPSYVNYWLLRRSTTITNSVYSYTVKVNQWRALTGVAGTYWEKGPKVRNK